MSVLSPPATDPNATRQTLLKRVRNLSDQGSWQEFFATYQSLIYSVATRSGLSHDEAEDVVQDTMLRMTHKLPMFNYDPAVGSFRGWLKKATRWCIIQRARRRLPQGTVPLEPTADAEIEAGQLTDPMIDPNFDAAWVQEEKQTLLRLATQRARAQVSDEQFQIYDCVVNKGWSAHRTATTLHLNLPKVYLAKCRVLKIVRAEVARLNTDPDP